jgi:CRP-like cAMP-binding protein/tetratricopeptide (TPR) repeat protein
MAEQPVGSRARFRTLGAEASMAIDAEDLLALARRYADQLMFDESIHLYEMAEKLRPGSVAIRINLARVRDLKHQAEESRFSDVRQEVAAERARDEVDASQYVGLAQYHMAKDQTSKAIELLELAKLKTPNNYRVYEILGRLYYSQGEWTASHEEIVRARQLNPFDRGLAELSGRVEFELKNFEKSLDDFVDAFLLATDQKGEATEAVRRMINTIKRISNIETKELNARIKSRVEQLQLLTERLEFRKESLFRVDSRELKLITLKITRDAEKRDNLIQVSSELRKLTVFQHMKDEQIFRLSRFTHIDAFLSNDYVFREDDRSMDFYVVRDGRFEIRKETPFGPQILGMLMADQIFGEMNFIDRTHRSSDALATESSSCYTFSFSALDQMMDEDKEIAVGLHWAFWRSLAEKVRDANEQLKLFFQEDAKRGAGRKRDEGKKREIEQVTVKSEEKVDLFKERGLSAAEMKLLATFSSEERFREGSMMFREGEKGEKLYIVLDGRVRISKFIPGVGEEALAVLDRGDFFGEMALIDDKPRSADAKAHEGDATVLSIDRATLNEILSMDPNASLQFLNLLCRMISRRLREINEKIVQWKYMSGGF